MDFLLVRLLRREEPGEVCRWFLLRSMPVSAERGERRILLGVEVVVGGGGPRSAGAGEAVGVSEEGLGGLGQVVKEPVSE